MLLRSLRKSFIHEQIELSPFSLQPFALCINYMRVFKAQTQIDSFRICRQQRYPICKRKLSQKSNPFFFFSELLTVEGNKFFWQLDTNDVNCIFVESQARMHFYEGPYFYHFPIITFLTFVCIVIRIVWSYNGKTAKDTNNKYLIDVKVRTFNNTLVTLGSRHFKVI